MLQNVLFSWNKILLYRRFLHILVKIENRKFVKNIAKTCENRIRLFVVLFFDVTNRLIMLIIQSSQFWWFSQTALLVENQLNLSKKFAFMDWEFFKLSTLPYFSCSEICCWSCWFLNSIGLFIRGFMLALVQFFH